MGRKESESDTMSSSSSSSSDYPRKRKRRAGSDSESSSSDDTSHRKSKRKRKHKRERSSVLKKRRKSKKKHRKRSSSDAEDNNDSKDSAAFKKANTKLQVTMEAREQEKFLIYQNAEIAKARLTGELKQAQAEQAKMQDMYGAIDWRARKKLRLEKKKLERSIAAGNKLAQMEEEENARMDAFRVALGLPTAEAQRQAEWRAQATRALVTQEPLETVPSNTKPPKKTIIGPQLPRM